MQFRQIIVNTTTYVYFQVYLDDGKTPAIGLAGQQPQIRIKNQLSTVDASTYIITQGYGSPEDDWTDNGIGPLEEMGYGNYQALLDDSVVGTVGNLIFSKFSMDNTLTSLGQPIQIVPTLSVVPIFENEGVSPPTILTYLSLPEAENYFATRFISDAWDNATQNQKIKALNAATNDINQLNFFGVKVDPKQQLEFPRYIGSVGSAQIGTSWYGVETDFDLNVKDIIEDPYHNLREQSRCKKIFPAEIKQACCEIAYNYLDGIDMEAEINKLNVESERYANVGQSYKRVTVNEAKRAGINSNKAWILLKPYLVDPLNVRLARV